MAQSDLATLTLRALSEGDSLLAFQSAQVSDRTGTPQTIDAMLGGSVAVTSTWRIYLPLLVR
ncbi:MAG: hypothetical protein ABIG63_22580 [Chloroflexota bacterium]